MPEVCSFNGISIKIVWKDHLPKHVHIICAGKMCRVTFNGDMLSGYLEADKYVQLKKWLATRQDELNDRWEKAQRKIKLERIKP